VEDEEDDSSLGGFLIVKEKEGRCIAIWEKVRKGEGTARNLTVGKGNCPWGEEADERASL